MNSVKFSVLDLIPVSKGGNAEHALANAVQLARHAERLGYHRYWVAEHHSNVRACASSPIVVISVIAAGTTCIHLGAGAVMIGNHSPYVVAEQYGTLASLFPSRIDLAVGRATGAPPNAMGAIYAGRSRARPFDDDVRELLHWLKDPAREQEVVAWPGAGSAICLWLAGASVETAQLANRYHLPFAFAQHLAPAAMQNTLAEYRAGQTPESQSVGPIVTCSVIAADEDATALRLYAESDVGRQVTSRRGGTLQSLLECPVEHRPSELRAIVGSKNVVREALLLLQQRSGAREIMITTHVGNLTDRLRSYEICREIQCELVDDSSTHTPG